MRPCLAGGDVCHGLDREAVVCAYLSECFAAVSALSYRLDISISDLCEVMALSSPQFGRLAADGIRVSIVFGCRYVLDVCQSIVRLAAILVVDGMAAWPRPDECRGDNRVDLQVLHPALVAETDYSIASNVRLPQHGRADAPQTIRGSWAAHITGKTANASSVTHLVHRFIANNWAPLFSRSHIELVKVHSTNKGGMRDA